MITRSQAKVLLDLWVIYDNPTDYPGKFVVRRWDVLEGFPAPIPAEECCVKDSLEAARRCVPQDKVNIRRDPIDDPAIAEVWV